MKKLVYSMLVLALIGAIVLSLAGCGEKPWKGRSLVHPVQVADYMYEMVYTSEGKGGNTTSSLSINIHGNPVVDESYSATATGNTDDFTIRDVTGVPRIFYTQNAREQPLTFMDLEKSKNTNATVSLPAEVISGTRTAEKYSVAVNELKFSGFATLLKLAKGDITFKAESYFKVTDDPNGFPYFNKGTAWYTSVSRTSFIGNGFSPFYAVIEGGALAQFPSDWALRNDTYDSYLTIARNGVIMNLIENSWVKLDSHFGKLRMVVYNPTSATDLLNAQSPFFGFAVSDGGETQLYRWIPTYIVLDSDLMYGAAKLNTADMGKYLQSLVLEACTPEMVCTPVGGIFFVKSRFANNSLYVVKRMQADDKAADIVAQIKTAMEQDVPENIQKLFDTEVSCSDCAEATEIENTLLTYLKNRKPWSVTDLVDTLGAEMVAVVKYHDASDKEYQCTWWDDGFCKKKEWITTMPRDELRWNASFSADGVDYTKSLLMFLGDPGLEAFSMDYVQMDKPDTPAVEKGDGFNFFVGTLQMFQHQLSGEISYNDAITPDSRCACSPENIQLGLERVFGFPPTRGR